jgi:hypothetical protein
MEELASTSYEMGFISRPLRDFCYDLAILRDITGDSPSLMAYLMQLPADELGAFRVALRVSSLNALFLRYGSAIDSLLSKPWNEVKQMLNTPKHERNAA